MINMRVHTAVRKKTHQMHSTIAISDPIEYAYQDFILEELSNFNRPSDTSEILIYNPSGTQIHMTNFGVPHLPVGKTDRQTGGF